MKILFLYTYNQGLLSNFYMDLGQQLSEDNNEVKIFSLKRKPEKLWIGNIEIEIEAKGGYLNNYFRIYNFIKNFSPDIIISNFSYDNPAMLAGKLLQIRKKIVWAHSLKNHGDPGLLRILLKRQFYKFADNIIVNSNILEDELKEEFKVNKRKIIAIPFWSNIEEINPIPIEAKKDSAKILVGCPGRFTTIKNQGVIIDALMKVNENLKGKIQVYFAGDGPTKKQIQRKVKKLDLQEQVVLLGVLSAGEMVDYYEKMDLIILPSLYESFGLVFIEAISLGTPVLVSSAFGALDFTDKGSEEIKKILFDPRDPENLAIKLQNMLEDHEMNSNFFKNIYSSHFNKEIIYKNVIKVLKE